MKFQLNYFSETILDVLLNTNLRKANFDKSFFRFFIYFLFTIPKKNGVPSPNGCIEKGDTVHGSIEENSLLSNGSILIANGSLRWNKL